MKTKPKLDADAAYENAHLMAQDVLDRVGELLFDLPAPGNEERPINWSHVADLNRVSTLLLEAVAFLERK